MHRLPFVLSAAALLAATLSGLLYFQIGNSKKVLEVQLAGATTRAAKLETDLAAANEQNGTLKANLATTSTELAVTRERLSSAELRAVVLDHDLTQAKGALAVQAENTRALANEVTALRRDLDEARASLASPEAVAAYKTTIAELERQLANARNGATATAGAGASTAVFSSRAGRATVLSVGPQSAFVVLNYGSTRGAKVGHKLEVSQGTQIVATVLISDVRTNFSVAQVLPETLRGVLQKGDSALLIR